MQVDLARPPSGLAALGWKLVTAGVVVLAIALRAPSVDYGLDLRDASNTIHNAQVDERAMVLEELELLGGDWQPGRFLMRGTAPFYVAGAADALAVWASALARGQGWDEALAAQEENPSLVFFVHRNLVLIAGVLTVYTLMRLVRREVGERCAIVAGLLLASAHMHVHLSSLGLVDVPWVLFALLSFDRALRAARDPRLAHFVWSGAWLGVASATKYPGGLVGIALVAALLVARLDAARSGRPRPSWGLFLAGAGATAVLFLAFCPRLLSHPGEYLEAIDTQVEILDVTERNDAYLAVLAGHARHALGTGLGETGLLAAVFGLGVALKVGGARRRLALFLCVFVPTALVAKTAAPRFATGLLVAVVPLAAIGIDALLARAPRAVGALVVLLALAPSLVRSIVYDQVLLSQRDTRLEMLDELARRELTEDDVLGVGYRGLPEPPGRPPRFKSLARELRRGRMRLEDMETNPPAWILRDLGAGLPDAQVWTPVAPLVEREYQEVLRIDGRRQPGDGVEPRGYYLVPRTYVPFREPWATTRPGPGLVLYRRRAQAGATE